ncbi:hypothetical protein ACWIUD_03110 [Helicobacter sp. 23-1044]
MRDSQNLKISPYLAINTPPQTPPARGGASLSPPPLRRGIKGVGRILF